MTIQFKPLSWSLGAEVLGVDLGAPVDDAAFAAIHQGFLRHGILVFRNQRITREQHIGFSRRFGPLDTHDALPSDRHPDFPELLRVTNEPKADGRPGDGKYTGHLWHSDMSFTLRPALGSLLRAIRIPPVGGDTLFANMTMAYDTLSPGMQRMLADLHGVHTGARKIVDLTPERAAETRRLIRPIAQPIVRVHPETGRKALYVGEKVSRLVDMTEDESRPLLTFLCRHATQQRHVYRHRWQADDIVMWDNRCTMHAALGDYDDDQPRSMERTTILGTPSGYLLQEETT